MKYAIITNVKTGEAYTLDHVMEHTRYLDSPNRFVVMSGLRLGKKVSIRFDIANFFVEIYECEEN